MSDLTPITREEALLDGQDLEPITRKEQFIKRIYDKTQEIPEPITREEWFLKKAGGGTSPVTIEQLNATENGTYSEQGKAYSPVIVEVPEPTLITKSITANGTYSASDDNADGYSSVTVAVEGFKRKSIANTPTDIASFNDGTANPMPSLEISIEPVQSGSGDPSPSNVRPISGWSGANVTREGKNLIKYPYYSPNGEYSSVTFNANSRRVIANGTSDAGGNFYFQYNYKLKKGTYTVSVTGKHVGANIRIYDKTTSTVKATLWSSTENAKETFTLTDDITNGMVYVNWSSSGAVIDFDCTLQIEVGNEATTYSPYQGSTSSIPFHDDNDNPLTVYGGVLNVTSGELRATMASVDLGTLNWNYSSSSVFFAASMSSNPKANSDGLHPSNALCSIYKTVGYEQVNNNNNTFDFSLGGGTIKVCNTAYTDAKAFKTAMSGIIAVYELAAPITYQLTPAQVTTLLGQNNIFADCGQVLEGEYFVTL